MKNMEIPNAENGQEEAKEDIIISGESVIIGEDITIGFNGDLITGVVESVEREGEEISVVVKEMSSPEKYLNMTGTFTYNEYQNRWSVQKK